MCIIFRITFASGERLFLKTELEIFSPRLILSVAFVSRYDHLSEVLSKILDERPKHCVGKLMLKHNVMSVELSSMPLYKLKLIWFLIHKLNLSRLNYFPVFLMMVTFLFKRRCL